MHCAGCLDSASQMPGKAWSASAPVIPEVYQLPPQGQIVMPTARFFGSTGTVSRGEAITVVKKALGMGK